MARGARITAGRMRTNVLPSISAPSFTRVVTASGNASINTGASTTRRRNDRTSTPFWTTVAATVVLCAQFGVAQQMPQTTKKEIAGTPTVKTEQLSGTVVVVDGNKLVVRMSSATFATSSRRNPGGLWWTAKS